PKAPPPPTLPPPDVTKMGDRLTILALEGVSGKDLSERLKKAVGKEVKVKVSSEETLSTYTARLKCAGVDGLCLRNVGAEVGSQYLLYGSVKEDKGQLSVELHLHDAKGGRE